MSVAARVKALVVTGEGLNCERETAHAFFLAGAEARLAPVTDLINREVRLSDFRIIAFIGGFADGDHLGAGTVLANRFRHSLGRELQEFLEAGRPLIGICNGFQTLVKMGILPGSPAEGRTATLLTNASGRFEDRWVHMLANPRSPCIWTRGIKRLFLPVRHGEGRFYCPDSSLLAGLKARGQVALQYTWPDKEEPTQDYPFNPNGSQEAIAGICDQSGLVFGLMPHPEGYLFPYNHPSWTRSAALGQPLPPEGQGVAVFRNAVAYVQEEGGGR